MPRPRTNNPPEDMIFPQGKGGYTFRLLPNTDPREYELGSIYGGISSVITPMHKKGDISVFDKNTTFPTDFKLIHGEPPRQTLFGKKENKERRSAQEFYTSRFSKLVGVTDLNVAFGDDAENFEGRIKEYAAGVAEWDLGNPVMYGESVTEYKAVKIRAEGREPEITYRFAFPTNQIMSELTRTMIPFQINAKPALGGDGVRTTARNYQIAVIWSGVIIERQLVNALRLHPAWAENERLKAERSKIESNHDKELSSIVADEEDSLLDQLG